MPTVEPPVVAIVSVVGAEHSAMKAAFAVDETDRKAGGGLLYYERLIDTDFNGPVRVQLHALGEAGNTASAAESARIVASGVSFMVLAGIAAGYRTKVKIGDVVVPRAVIDGTVQAVTDGRYGPRPTINTPLKGVLQMNAAAGVDIGEWHESFNGLLAGARPQPGAGQEDDFHRHVAQMPSLHESAVLSTNLLIGDPQVLIDAASDLHQQVRAGEMEAAGFVKACTNHYPPIPWYVVRGVSDFGDALKNDTFHAFAAGAVASYVALYVKHVLDLRIWGHVGGPRRRQRTASWATAAQNEILDQVEPAAEDAYSPVQALRRRAAALIDERTAEFVGREYVFDEFERFVATNDRGYFTVEGDPGAGKTAILAEHARRTGCIVHFNVSSEGIRSADQFIGAIADQLSEKYGIAPVGREVGSENRGVTVSRLLSEARAAAPPGEPLVIVVDALDEAWPETGEANVLSLPESLPEGVYLLLSQRRVNLPLRMGVPARLYDLNRHHAETMVDIDGYLRRMSRRPQLAPLVAKVGLRRFTRKLAERSEGNFMYLRYVLPELVGESLDLEELPLGLHQYYKWHWQRMEMATRPPRLLQIWVIYLLCEIARPVSCRLLADVLHGVEAIRDYPERVDAVAVQNVLSGWLQFLHRDRAPDGARFSVYHASFRDYLRDHDLVASGGLSLPGVHDVIQEMLWRQWQEEDGDES